MCLLKTDVIRMGCYDPVVDYNMVYNRVIATNEQNALPQTVRPVDLGSFSLSCRLG